MVVETFWNLFYPATLRMGICIYIYYIYELRTKFGTWRRDITKVGWAPIGFAVAAPWTNLPQGIVLGTVLGWAPIGFAVMVTPRPSQYYFGHT